MTVVLDTCAIVGAVSDPGQLSPRAASLLAADDTEVCVSATSCAEIACAAEHGRLVIAEARLRSAPVVTADARILDYPHVRTVW